MADLSTSQPGSPGVLASLTRLLELAGGIATLAGLLFGLGVMVRWLAFVVDPNIRAAAFLAPTSPVTELAFLGAQRVLSPAPIAVGILVVVSTIAFRPHMARTRAVVRSREAGRQIEALSAQIDEMATEVTQEALKAEPSRDKLERSLEDLRRIQGELHTRSQEMEAGFRDADSIHLPGDHLSYPIHRFGLAFSSRRAFVAFAAGIGLLVAQAVVSLDFPAPQIDQAGMWVSLVLLFRGIFVGGQLTARTILSVFLVALAAATISGAIAYRVPVGAYDWGESSSLTDGNYALVGENDSTVFVVPCNEAPAGVTAIPREAVIRINFPHDALEPRGPSLLQIATVPGSSPRIGALAVCRA